MGEAVSNGSDATRLLVVLDGVVQERDFDASGTRDLTAFSPIGEHSHKR